MTVNVPIFVRGLTVVPSDDAVIPAAGLYEIVAPVVMFCVEVDVYVAVCEYDTLPLLIVPPVTGISATVKLEIVTAPYDTVFAACLTVQEPVFVTPPSVYEPEIVMLRSAPTTVVRFAAVTVAVDNVKPVAEPLSVADTAADDVEPDAYVYDAVEVIVVEPPPAANVAAPGVNVKPFSVFEFAVCVAVAVFVADLPLIATVTVTAFEASVEPTYDVPIDVAVNAPLVVFNVQRDFAVIA